MNPLYLLNLEKHLAVKNVLDTLSIALQEVYYVMCVVYSLLIFYS